MSFTPTIAEQLAFDVTTICFAVHNIKDNSFLQNFITDIIPIIEYIYQSSIVHTRFVIQTFFKVKISPSFTELGIPPGDGIDLVDKIHSLVVSSREKEGKKETSHDLKTNKSISSRLISSRPIVSTPVVVNCEFQSVDESKKIEIVKTETYYRFDVEKRFTWV